LGVPPKACQGKITLNIQTVLAHPQVAISRFDGDYELASVFINAFNDKGNEFPVKFYDAWQFLGYSTKSNALRKLKGGGFKEGLDYKHARGVVIETDQNPYGPDEDPDQGGRPVEQYYLTKDAFKTFAMVAMTKTCNRVRQLFRAIPRRLCRADAEAAVGP
jgi:hypothetical protein